MLKLFKWLDDNIVALLAAFLLLFIPLYPKLPLFDVLPGYIVRIRLEDFLVAGILGIWLIWFIRKKLNWIDNPLVKFISAYLIVGFLSILSAIFISQTIPKELLHINKTLLHYLRRIEYLSLFFVFYSSVKSLRQIKIYITLIIIAVVGVVLYGFGQKYLYWPAFSTMNREFAKGWTLYLTPHARVLSTFGGHYDLAAYIMMVLILLWAFFFTFKSWLLKGIIFLILSGAFWTLILTASRTSFLAYLFGLMVLFFLWSFKKGLEWSLKRWVLVTVLSIVVMLSFGDLSERFTKLLRIDERISGIKSLLLSPIGSPPGDRAIFLENNPQAVLDQIASKSDTPPSTKRPSDVYQDIPLYVPNGTESGSVSAIARTYSKTAFQYDLSTAIRLDALWPMAIKGFLKNPVFGSGYATLNKIQATDFTEAESTDNDYLRNLGETGLLGFITFFSVIVFALYFIWRNLNTVQDPLIFAATIGLGGLTAGLLANAVYIDVFESSKVAFTFWPIVGFVLAAIKISKQKENNIALPTIPGLKEFKNKNMQWIKKFVKSDIFLLLLILSVTFCVRLYKIREPLADWHSWRQADTSAVTRNYVKYGVNILYPTYDDLSNVASGMDNPKGYRFVEFPAYNIVSVIIDKIFVGFSIEFSGRLTSILATCGTILFIFLIVKRHFGRKEAVISSFVYALLPYNVFFTRIILPEPFFVFTSTAMLYFIDIWTEGLAKGTSKYRSVVLFFISLLFTSVSFLGKPFTFFLVLPLLFLWFKNLKLSIRSLFGVLFFLLLSVIPFFLWRVWISHFPEGVPAYVWLLNGDGIRFKGAFFYWLFADRLGRMILGYWGISFFVFGILSAAQKRHAFFLLWGLSMIMYLFFFATGNVRHDYYQIPLIPIIAIFVGRGITFLIDIRKWQVSSIAIYLVLIISSVFTLMFGWYFIRDLYNINHPEIIDAGLAVEAKTPNKSLVIAPYDGDTAFLYQTKRAGWPIMQDSIENMIKKGAQFYVSVKYDQLTNDLLKDALLADESKRKYKLIIATDKYVLIQLVPDSKLLK